MRIVIIAQRRAVIDDILDFIIDFEAVVERVRVRMKSSSRDKSDRYRLNIYLLLLLLAHSGKCAKWLLRKKSISFMF